MTITFDLNELYGRFEVENVNELLNGVCDSDIGTEEEEKEKYRIVKFLIQERNVNLEEVYTYPVFHASCNNRNRIVKFLLQHGASYCQDCLIEAIANENMNLIKYFVEERNVDIYIEGEVYTPLGTAACGNLTILEYLLNHGADINCDGEGYALIEAIQENKLDNVKFLVDRGADVNIQYHNFENVELPLKVALEKGNEEIISFLREHGAHE